MKNIIFRLCRAYCVLTEFIPRLWRRRRIHSEIMSLRLKGEWCKCTRALHSFGMGAEPMHSSESLLGNSMVTTASC
jgi:hypothetical protein